MQPEPASHIPRPLFAPFEQPYPQEDGGVFEDVAYGIDYDIADEKGQE